MNDWRSEVGESPPSGPPQEFREDEELLAKGWVRRTMTDPERAAEACELYRSLGFDVELRNLHPSDFGPDCGGCAHDACRSYVLVYTRKAVSYP